MPYAHDNGRRPGRPSKFGRPSRVVAFTLPDDVIDRLRRVHRDIGWAVVKLLDAQTSPAASPRNPAEPDVELITLADRQSLIVVNREAIRKLPGVNIVPLGSNRAFLALGIDRGMSDLELAVNDRLEDTAIGERERQALEMLQTRLRTWRRDRALRVHTRAIILVEDAGVRTRARRTLAARRRADRRRPDGAQPTRATASPEADPPLSRSESTNR